jgi:hypothetical protein
MAQTPGRRTPARRAAPRVWLGIAHVLIELVLGARVLHQLDGADNREQVGRSFTSASSTTMLLRSVFWNSQPIALTSPSVAAFPSRTRSFAGSRDQLVVVRGGHGGERVEHRRGCVGSHFDPHARVDGAGARAGLESVVG